jgi:hypothetical protein
MSSTGAAVDFDKCNRDARTRAVRLDDDAVVRERPFQVIDLEGDVRHSLHELRIGRVVPVPLPLDPERVVEMIADGHAQVWQRDLTLERVGRWDPDVVEPHVAIMPGTGQRGLRVTRLGGR